MKLYLQFGNTLAEVEVHVVLLIESFLPILRYIYSCYLLGWVDSMLCA